MIFYNSGFKWSVDGGSSELILLLEVILPAVVL